MLAPGALACHMFVFSLRFQVILAAQPRGLLLFYLTQS